MTGGDRMPPLSCGVREREYTPTQRRSHRHSRPRRESCHSALYGRHVELRGDRSSKGRVLPCVAGGLRLEGGMSQPAQCTRGPENCGVLSPNTPSLVRQEVLLTFRMSGPLHSSQFTKSASLLGSPGSVAGFSQLSFCNSQYEGCLGKVQP